MTMTRNQRWATWIVIIGLAIGIATLFAGCGLSDALNDVKVGKQVPAGCLEKKGPNLVIAHPPGVKC